LTEIKVNVSELKSEGKDIIEELAGFLKEKTKAEIEAATDFLTVKGEVETLSKAYLRTILKKFLHKKELKDYFRVISGEEDTLIIKEKKLFEEE
jgi:hypothetical protein